MAMTIILTVASGCPSDDSVPESADSTASPFKPVITLAVNDWTASAVNVAIAEQLIERNLGYPVVPTRADDTTAMYEALADGSLDAVLEIWPSAVTERDQRFFDRGQLVELGPLGPVGQVGWFVPRYVIDDHPILATWSGFQGSEAAALFATAETVPAGRFLGLDPSYRQFDQDIIDSLGLPFVVEFSGSEKLTMTALEASAGARKPIVVYWWTPTAAVATYDLVNVALPEPPEACCGYPADPLIKVGSPQLQDKAPEVLRFLQSFTISTGDQIDLLVAVESNGQTIAAAAAEWIAANGATWQAWLSE